MADTTILIHDPEVVRDIERLAERTGKPATEDGLPLKGGDFSKTDIIAA